MGGDIHLFLSCGRNITKLVECRCPWDVCLKGMTILIGYLNMLETQAITAIVLRVLGSQSFHHITGGKMMLVDCVLARTYYGWVKIILSLVK